MGDVVEISRYASAKDKRLLAEIVQSAQLAQAFARYERAFFLTSPEDQRKIAERLVAMAQAARQLSRAVRDRTSELPWDELIAAGEAAAAARPDAIALWTAVKKVVPRITAALGPLAGDAASVFAWTPPPKAPRAAKPAAKAARGGQSGRRKRADRRE